MTTNASTAQTVTAKISPNDKGNPADKLVDAELHFGDGVLDPIAGFHHRPRHRTLRAHRRHHDR